MPATTIAFVQGDDFLGYQVIHPDRGQQQRQIDRVPPGIEKPGGGQQPELGQLWVQQVIAEKIDAEDAGQKCKQEVVRIKKHSGSAARNRVGNLQCRIILHASDATLPAL